MRIGSGTGGESKKFGANISRLNSHATGPGGQLSVYEWRRDAGREGCKGVVEIMRCLLAWRLCKQKPQIKRILPAVCGACRLNALIEINNRSQLSQLR